MTDESRHLFRVAPIGLVALLAPTLALGSGVEVVSRSAAAGATVAVEVRLTGESSDLVAGAQVDISFNPEQVTVPPGTEATDKPDCRVNSEIDKLIDGSETFGFGYLRAGVACNPASETCDSVRAIVLSTDNVDPIAAGATLFSCNFKLAEGLSEGTMVTLDAGNAIGSDPAGQRAAEFTGQGGTIAISGGVACVGDCDADGAVSIGDLQRGLNIFFGTADVTTCAAMDEGGDGAVSIGDLQRGLNNFFGSCP